MNLSQRLKLIVENMTPASRRFVALEEATQINAKTWQTWWSRGGRASADMVESAGKAWPQYAFWLVTGIDDFAHGHSSPEYLTWREAGIPVRERTSGWELFQKKIELERCKQSKISGEDEHFLLRKKSLVREVNQLNTLRAAQEKAINELEASSDEDAIRDARSQPGLSNDEVEKLVNEYEKQHRQP
ncbi:hypothetical protein [Janthinobacterium sp. CG_23.3]|uniref:hypothetical protein n=1 Tax=Janthinobacterium sp. CG_23.3 TaxID=3349634 RepID=UPI0038D427BF